MVPKRMWGVEHIDATGRVSKVQPLNKLLDVECPGASLRTMFNEGTLRLRLAYPLNGKLIYSAKIEGLLFVDETNIPPRCIEELKEFRELLGV